MNPGPQGLLVVSLVVFFLHSGAVCLGILDPKDRLGLRVFLGVALKVGLQGKVC